jgi:hypothetical protein
MMNQMMRMRMKMRKMKNSIENWMMKMNLMMN